jgi:hypothetical protein
MTFLGLNWVGLIAVGLLCLLVVTIPMGER